MVAMSAIVALACGGQAKVQTPAASPATRTVTDDLGRTVTIPARVTRVISLAPNLTEDVFAVGAGDRLVGVTTYCNFPEQAKTISKVGDTMTPNIETIVALKPELVLVSTASQIEAFMKTLADNNVAVYVTKPESLDGVLRNLTQIGDLLGETEKASALVGDLKRRTADVEAKTKGEKPSKVFVQFSREPIFTIGKQGFLNGLIESAGGVSATANIETAFPNLSKETALTMDPDVIILSDSEDNREVSDAFRSSPAVRNKRVVRINPDILSRPGPRLVDALEEIARDLHPEKFERK